MGKKAKPPEPKAEPPQPSKTNLCDVLAILIHRAFGFFTSALWPACVMVGTYFLYLSVEALAGKETNAKIVANVMANWGLDKIIGYMVGGSGAAYGMYERRQRRTVTKNLRQQAEELERLHDRDRTGTGLLPGGDAPTDH